jgi:hypothetical protein
MPVGWLPPSSTVEVVVVADWVVVGSVLVVVGPTLVVVGLELVVVGLELVVVGLELVVVGPLVVGSAVVVVNSVVVGSVVVVETTVVVDAVVLDAVVMLEEVMEECVVAPGLECVLEAVASLRSGASAVVPRPVVAIGRLAADGLVSGLLDDGEGGVVDSSMVVLVVKVEVGAGSVVTVGRATPGAGCGDGAWGGNKVAEATRAARTAKVSPKATSRSLQGRRGLARCRGEGFGISIVPVRLLLPDAGCPWRRPHYRAHRP